MIRLDTWQEASTMQALLKECDRTPSELQSALHLSQSIIYARLHKWQRLGLVKRIKHDGIYRYQLTESGCSTTFVYCPRHRTIKMCDRIRAVLDESYGKSMAAIARKLQLRDTTARHAMKLLIEVGIAKRVGNYCYLNEGVVQR